MYESPAVDTTDAFTDSVSTESESERVPCNAEKCSQDKGEHLTEFTSTKSYVLPAEKNTSSNGLAEFKSYATDKSRFHQYNNEVYLPSLFPCIISSCCFHFLITHMVVHSLKSSETPFDKITSVICHGSSLNCNLDLAFMVPTIYC